jgi:hypothetical protein
MSRQFWNECIDWAGGSGTAIANTTTETAIFTALTVPANYMKDGRTLLLRAKGQYSTTSAPTLTFRVRWGAAVSGTLIATSGAITAGSGVTAALWEAEVLMTVRSNGATGTVMAIGKATVGSATAPTVGSATGAPGIALMSAGGITTPAVATCDFTTATALTVSAAWGTGDPANTLTGLVYTLNALN